jgi:hypothetical protein
LELKKELVCGVKKKCRPKFSISARTIVARRRARSMQFASGALAAAAASCSAQERNWDLATDCLFDDMYAAERANKTVHVPHIGVILSAVSAIYGPHSALGKNISQDHFSYFLFIDLLFPNFLN